MFIMIDGIDGSGKSTILNTWKEYLTEQGKKIFDLKEYWIEHHAHPELKKLEPFDVIFSCEPTYTHAGLDIRDKKINNKKSFSAQSIAMAYSLDRLELYKKLIIPLHAQGKTIIQDRGVSTTFAYQTTQDNGLTIEELKKLSGNEIALKYAPDHLVLLDLQAEQAFERLRQRNNKQDDAIFENLEFQKKLVDEYRSETYRKIFSDRSTVIHYLLVDCKIDIMKMQAIQLLKTITNL
ncbi:MAG: deoxynucleoside kinase [bacterium]